MTLIEFYSTNGFKKVWHAFLRSENEKIILLLQDYDLNPYFANRSLKTGSFDLVKKCLCNQD